ncbi:MAG TPA: ATPase domain-containing protein [Geminicoccus sp.]|nr:ATPase domain-containing protein [Geminicoccus sp.]HEX2528958.1 ATPase domain-containing protein [Geminicoccus sp.]
MNAHLSGKARTGLPGLDNVLGGGLARGHLYLLEGNPGTGKTTVALHFLIDGAARGEKCLYITLSETERELKAGATSHGWTLNDTIKVFELVPPESLLDSNQQQSLLYSADLELGETTRLIFEVVEREQPDLIVLDSLSEIRLLAQSSLRYRRQILALKHYFARIGSTVLMLDDLTSDTLDRTVHSIAHGVIRMEELAPNYGAQRRRLRVMKYRGQSFRGGYHDMTIKTGGVFVFPRLVASEHRASVASRVLTCQIPELDALLGGGIDAGSNAVLLGPAGIGKSILTLQFISAAIARGEKAALFIFDEELGLLLKRARSIGIDLAGLKESGHLLIEQVDAAEMSPGEFTHWVRDLVSIHQVRTVVIDGLNGYQASMPDESFLILHLHELLQYLNRQGAATFLTIASHGLVGELRVPIDITYMADTVILLRYFEAAGRIRRAISVIKKRAGPHEDTIREFQITTNGIKIGMPLHGFQGVLLGAPTYVGDIEPLLEKDEA